MSNNIYYLIYRVYSEKENPNSKERSKFYGWSSSKKIIKVFMTQRDERKYKVVKTSENEINKLIDTGKIDDVYVDDGYMITYIYLTSVINKQTIPFFSTQNELYDAEIKIQRMFNELCSLSNMKCSGSGLNMLEMILNLDDWYGSALYYLGYRPPDLNTLFPMEDEADGYSGIYKTEMLITEAYEGVAEFPKETDEPGGPLGLLTLEDVSNKILYSVESFVKVLKEDL